MPFDNEDPMLKPLTKDTYPDYIYQEDDIQMLLGYWDATASANRTLKEIASSNSVDELKGKLLDFIKSRDDFIDCLQEDWDETASNFKKAVHYVQPS